MTATFTPITATDNYTEFIQSLPLETQEVISALPQEVAHGIRRLGDTWILRPTLIYNKKENFCATPFYSNGELFTQIAHFFNGDSNCLFYNKVPVKREHKNWLNDRYRIISFTTKFDNNLLEWLKVNAVRL